MKDFKKNLKPLKNKISFEKFLYYFSISIAVSSFLSIILLILSKFMFFPNVWQIIGVIFLIGFTISLLIWKLKPIHIENVAKVADDLGGKELIITTLELLEKENTNSTEKIVIEKGCNMVVEKSFSNNYRVKYPVKVFKLISVLFAIMMLVGFIPINVDDELLEATNLELKKVEQVIKEINKNENITEEEKEIINKVLQQLEKDLKKITSKDDIKKTTENAQEQLKQLEKEQLGEDLKSIAEEMKNETAGMNLYQGAMANDLNAMSKSLEKFQEEVGNLDNQEKAELSNAINSLSETVDSEELKEALKNISENISGNKNTNENKNENTNNSELDMSQLEEAISKEMSESEHMREAINNANNQLGEQGQNENGNQEGNQEGNQNSQGNENSQGNQDGNNGNGQGRGDSAGEYNEDGTLDESNQNSYDTKVSGDNHYTEQKTYVEQKVIGNDGIAINYNEVLEDYKVEALEIIQSENIPYGMSQLVSDYFMQLEK